MSSQVAHFFAIFAVILTHGGIVSVKGQCTTDRCEDVDSSLRIVAEIQQQSAQEIDQLKKQVENINNLLTASLNQQTSRLDAVLRSLQALDSRSREHDDNIKQMQRIHEKFNESLQEMKSLQALDSRSAEHDVYIKQIQSIHEQFNESLQEMKSLKAADRPLQQEHTCFQKGQGIHELLNESYQEMRNQHDTVMTSLEAVTRNLQEHDIAIENQTHKLSKLVNDTCDPASELCDCSDIKGKGQTTSGVYEVCVGRLHNRTCTSAYCDMGGSTDNRTSLVFQRRKDGSENFNRTWTDYRQGFGNRDGEFWLGNEMLYLLTSTRNYSLRVDLEDFSGEKRFASYTSFSISSSATNYTLGVSGYSGNAGDSLAYHNGRQFSTMDVNNDKYKHIANCAKENGGGWWFAWCSHSSLNGRYYHQLAVSNSRSGIRWNHWLGIGDSLKTTEMKLVPVA